LRHIDVSAAFVSLLGMRVRTKSTHS
jgi:hypothetical protein